MLFLVSGKGKHDIVARVLGGADLPAAHAYAQGTLTWMMDRAAAEGT
jgi:6-phosphogluconolactonase/glucosamine-6-phosphate isomerase/deaminase